MKTSIRRVDRFTAGTRTYLLEIVDFPTPSEKVVYSVRGTGSTADFGRIAVRVSSKNLNGTRRVPSSVLAEARRVITRKEANLMDAAAKSAEAVAARKTGAQRDAETMNDWNRIASSLSTKKGRC